MQQAQRQQQMKAASSVCCLLQLWQQIPCPPIDTPVGGICLLGIAAVSALINQFSGFAVFLWIQKIVAFRTKTQLRSRG